MSKVRVYELSKELGMQSKKLIPILQEMNIDVKNHMCTMDEQIAKKVLEMLTKGERKPIDDLADPVPTEEKKEALGLAYY